MEMIKYLQDEVLKQENNYNDSESSQELSPETETPKLANKVYEDALDHFSTIAGASEGDHMDESYRQEVLKGLDSEEEQAYLELVSSQPMDLVPEILSDGTSLSYAPDELDEMGENATAL